MIPPKAFKFVILRGSKSLSLLLKPKLGGQPPSWFVTSNVMCPYSLTNVLEKILLDACKFLVGIFLESNDERTPLG